MRNILLVALMAGILISCGGEKQSHRATARVISGRGPVSKKPNLPNSNDDGDVYAPEFKKIAEEIVSRLVSKNIPTVAGVSVDQLARAIQSTDVKSVEASLLHPAVTTDFTHPLCIDQELNPEPAKGWERVDAINCREQKKIIFSLVNWKAALNLTQKQRLVVHEYLGIIGVNDAGFAKSDEILRSYSSI